MNDNEQNILNDLSDLVETGLTGIPAPIRKNFFKAVSQLCTAVVDVPVAWLEGKSDEIRANTEARKFIIKQQGKNLSEQIKVPQEYIDKASEKFSAKIVKEQLNLDAITHLAKVELENSSEYITEETEISEISEDWLNEFENTARTKSSEDMKLAFSKILAGEIRKPNSFSIKTIKLLSQLDNEAAKLFQILCSLSISMRFKETVLDARVVSFVGNPGSNSLINYGLSFNALNILNEYGLIISDYNSYMQYNLCIPNKETGDSIKIEFQNKKYNLIPRDIEKFDKDIKLSGVALTQVGRELLNIIPLVENIGYRNNLYDFFKTLHLDMVEI